MEGVDRNISLNHVITPLVASPSAWRVWIEIFCIVGDKEGLRVTLRMEGVDRNTTRLFKKSSLGYVTLRMEGVD